MSDIEKKYYDNAFYDYQHMFPFFPWVCDGDDSNKKDFLCIFDGLSEGGTADDFEQYLFKRMMQLAKSSNINPLVTNKAIAITLGLELLRGLTLTLMNMREDLENICSEIRKKEI